MPLHTIGVQIPNSFYGITFGDVMTCVVALLYYWMPGVDHQALMQWIIDNSFYGSIAACSMFGTFYSHKLLEWGGMGLYALLYLLEGFTFLPGSKLIKAAKIDPTEPWAWNDTTKIANAYKSLQWKSILYILKYHAVVCVVQFLIFASAINYTWSEGRFNWSWIVGHPELKRADPATIPSKATVAYQCLVSTFVAETGFYFAHRLMHETSLYYWHKVYATFYVGFLDSVITDFIPAGFGIVYFEMHQWTVWMFTLPLIANALRVHCGYDNARLMSIVGGFNPTMTLPMCTDAERTHDMHHRFNTCNYGGAYFLWDRILGTWANPDLEQAEKKAGKPITLPKPQRFTGVEDAPTQKTE